MKANNALRRDRIKSYKNKLSSLTTDTEETAFQLKEATEADKKRLRKKLKKDLAQDRRMMWIGTILGGLIGAAIVLFLFRDFILYLF